MKKTTMLRKLLASKEILVAPGAHDVMTAKIIEQAGFNAVYMTGYGASATILGRPDVGLLTLTEMATQARNIANAVNIPVIADADTGYGNVVNVMRTVREYEKAGVACIQLEDQVAPKRCGHMLGRDVIPMEEMVAKIRAAVEARQDPDLMIMARTDARTNYGIEEAIRRGKAYEEAGADILFIESPENEEEMRLVGSSFNVPVLANMIEKGRTPLKTAKELEEMGFGLVIWPLSSLYVTAKAVRDLMVALKEEGTAANMMDKMIPFTEFNELIGLPEIDDIQNRFKVED
ncbi:MAG: isocitrate lyase/PEP mutase family protein [bacterium]|mgnify:CR=1 FL=1|jgi:carboxyvinyl-carboxyphosphonate phosphorylmutase|nr:isocitrate lyase/PEP mutase family protein [Bacillota bacterium]